MVDSAKSDPPDYLTLKPISFIKIKNRIHRTISARILAKKTAGYTSGIS